MLYARLIENFTAKAICELDKLWDYLCNWWQ
jgi:hypothetical protein